MTVFITGIRGFLGAALAEHLRRLGHQVRGSASSPGGHGLPVIRLGESVPNVFGGVEALIHCAHDLSSGSRDRNIRGSQMIRDAARDSGVRRLIFISSVSARPDAVTEYGRTKYEIEPLFDTVVRPGWVIGPGGLFGRVARFARRWRVAAYPAGAQVPVVALEDFTFAIRSILERETPGAYNLFTMAAPRQLLLAAVPGVIALPVPAAMLDCLLALPLPLPVQRDNLRALRQNQTCPWPSDLERLLPLPPRKLLLRK